MRSESWGTEDQHLRIYRVLAFAVGSSQLVPESVLAAGTCREEDETEGVDELRRGLEVQVNYQVQLSDIRCHQTQA